MRIALLLLPLLLNAQDKTNYLQTYPDDIWFEILSHVAKNDWSAVALVNKGLNRYAHDKYFWQRQFAAHELKSSYTPTHPKEFTYIDYVQAGPMRVAANCRDYVDANGVITFESHMVKCTIDKPLRAVSHLTLVTKFSANSTWDYLEIGVCEKGEESLWIGHGYSGISMWRDSHSYPVKGFLMKDNDELTISYHPKTLRVKISKRGERGVKFRVPQYKTPAFYIISRGAQITVKSFTYL